MYGKGQGSNNSTWARFYISNIILKCHRSMDYGAQYFDPERINQMHLYIAGFVDNINLSINFFTLSYPIQFNQYSVFVQIHKYLAISYGQLGKI